MCANICTSIHKCIQTHEKYIPFPGIVKLLVEDTATALSVSIPAIVVTVTTTRVCGMSG